MADINGVNCNNISPLQDSEDLRKDSSKEILSRITDLVNDTLSTDPLLCNITLSEEGILAGIDKGKSEGGPSGRHWVLDPIDGTKGYVILSTITDLDQENFLLWHPFVSYDDCFPVFNLYSFMGIPRVKNYL
jgi:Inositol monophosphatase family